MRTLVSLSLALLSTAFAGNFNVANLVHEQEITIEVECDKRIQPILLPAGSDSGTFTLPEKEAVFRAKGLDLAPYKVPAARAGRLILLYRKNNKLTWHTITSKAEQGKTSLRLLNLTNEPVKLHTAEQDIELNAGQDLESAPTKSASIALTLAGQKKQTAKAEEPTAFIGVIYPTPQGPRLQIIADR